jgi:N-acetylated-alpha-linked acidic dipeptidase
MLPTRSAALVGAFLLLPAHAPSDGAPMRGFTPASARVERDWEAKFQAVPSPDSLREFMRILSARPHHLGSPRDSVNAAWILDRFRA